MIKAELAPGKVDPGGHIRIGLRIPGKLAMPAEGGKLVIETDDAEFPEILVPIRFRRGRKGAAPVKESPRTDDSTSPQTVPPAKATKRP